MYDVIIAEKPSVAQKIAHALSKNVVQKRFGKVKYFEVNIEGRKVVVLPAAGHLFALTSSGGFPIFSYEWAPAWAVSKRAAFTKKYFDLMKAFVCGADRIISGCDYDIEGSTIAWNIIRAFADVTRAARMHFSTLTKDELRNAYINLEPYDIERSLAGETRHIVDWLWGINLSRAAMAAIRAAGRRATLSIGRVQGPMLRYIVEREREISNFVPKSYWELFVFARGTKFIHAKGKFFDFNEVNAAQLRTQREGIIEITQKKKLIPPPPPFDFTTLQIEAWKAFRFSPTTTQKIAQSLYEKSLISYPRTASQKLPQKLNLREIIQKLAQTKNFRTAKKLVDEGRFIPREGKAIDPAHPAIYPTGIVQKIKGNELKLYNLIVSRFLSCFAKPAEIVKRKTILRAGSEEYVAETQHITEHGWLKFYKWHGIKEDPIPKFKDGERVKVEKFEVLKKQTTPPQRFSPADIITLLEKKGIGTKATRSQILDVLYKRKYIVGKQIKPTPLGISIFDTFAEYAPQIVDPELTTQLDEKLNAIAEGKGEQKEVIEGTKKILHEILERIKGKEKEIGAQFLKSLRKTETFAPCKCGGALRIIGKGQNLFLGCSNYPKCQIIYSLPRKRFSFVKMCRCGAPIVKVWRNEFCLNKECSLSKQKD